jgi:putative restriction endonuclease
MDLALEAAHIKWVQAGGPDSVANGICCCSIHHQALDAGAIGIDEDLRILISTEIHGSSLDAHFDSLRGHRLLLPSRKIAYPKREYVSWHQVQVFKGSPRD